MRAGACMMGPHPLAGVAAAGVGIARGWIPDGVHLYAEQDAEFAVAGELDLSCADLFATTLGCVVPLCCGPELVVEGVRVESPL
jgi:hypothetical protein